LHYSVAISISLTASHGITLNGRQQQRLHALYEGLKGHEVNIESRWGQLVEPRSYALRISHTVPGVITLEYRDGVVIGIQIQVDFKPSALGGYHAVFRTVGPDGQVDDTMDLTFTDATSHVVQEFKLESGHLIERRAPRRTVYKRRVRPANPPKCLSPTNPRASEPTAGGT